MAELPTGFWSGWVIVLTLASLAGLAWLTLSVYFMPDVDHDPDSEPVWDGDVREGSNAPPLWWFWMLLGAMVFSLVYLILYPGLGSYKGLLNWSAGTRIAERYESFDQQFSADRALIAAADLADIQNDLNLMDTADRIFKRECSACHGPDGRGQANMFPNLQDIDWQWGSTPEQIEQTIRDGRNPVMPPWRDIIGEQNVQLVAEYLRLFNTATASTHAGKPIYDQNCIACHGADGTGNIFLGAPNLVDTTWLYGDTDAAIHDSIAFGRNGIMPAFGQRLDDAQIRLLVAMLAR